MLEIRSMIGDASPCGLEAMRLSIRGACRGTWSIFGAKADDCPRDTPDLVAASLVDDSLERRLFARNLTPSLGQFGSVCGSRALQGIAQISVPEWGFCRSCKGTSDR